MNALRNEACSSVYALRAYLDDRKVSVDGKVYSADHVLVAVGGYPTWPDVPGAEYGISSDGFFELEKLPK